jgi:hypothetical protein
MQSKTEKLLHRDRCLDMAEMAPTEAIRTKLLSVARLYEIEANLVNRARQCIADSKGIDRRGRITVKPTGYRILRVRSKTSASPAISRHCRARSRYIFRSLSSVTSVAARSHSTAFVLQASTRSLMIRCR